LTIEGKHLTGLTALQYLSLAGCKSVTDQCLEHLSGLALLRNLILRNCNRLIGEGLKLLSNLTALQHLHLGWCHSGRTVMTLRSAYHRDAARVRLPYGLYSNIRELSGGHMCDTLAHD
jgi:hypothetical protein